MPHHFDFASKDKKRENKISTATALLSSLLGVPLSLAVLLPLGVVYHLLRALVRVARGQRPIKARTWPPVEAATKLVLPPGHKVKPLEDRKWDIVLVGATGFTGQIVARYLATQYKGKGLKWAISGRRAGRLRRDSHRARRDL